MEEGLEVQDGTEGPTKELGIMHAFDPWLTTKGKYSITLLWYGLIGAHQLEGLLETALR
jgi:hypothetical protein